jgi:hypothetical protein
VEGDGSLFGWQRAIFCLEKTAQPNKEKRCLSILISKITFANDILNHDRIIKLETISNLTASAQHSRLFSVGKKMPLHSNLLQSFRWLCCLRTLLHQLLSLLGALPSLTEDRSISACLNVAKHGKEKRYTGSAKDQLSSLPF